MKVVGYVHLHTPTPTPTTHTTLPSDDPNKYPVSKSRLEPLGIAIFATVMSMASVLVIREAVGTLISDINQPSAVAISS